MKKTDINNRTLSIMELMQAFEPVFERNMIIIPLGTIKIRVEGTERTGISKMTVTAVKGTEVLECADCIFDIDELVNVILGMSRKYAIEAVVKERDKGLICTHERYSWNDLITVGTGVDLERENGCTVIYMEDSDEKFAA